MSLKNKFLLAYHLIFSIGALIFSVLMKVPFPLNDIPVLEIFCGFILAYMALVIMAYMKGYLDF